MISGTVKQSGRWNILSGLSGGILDRDDMRKIADFGVATVKARVARGIGGDDAAMPPIKVEGVGRRGRPREIKYAQQKGTTIRNLRSPGSGPHMMDQLDVVSATDDSALITFTTPDALKKAAVNEHRYPFIGWSNRDAATVAGFAENLVSAKVRALASGK